MFRYRLLRTLGLLFAIGWLGFVPLHTRAVPGRDKKKPSETAQAAPGVLKSEANMVLVNVIVTDKQGNYLRDLSRKDFHVFEDGKEQPVISLSREADTKPASPGGRRADPSSKQLLVSSRLFPCVPAIW